MGCLKVLIVDDDPVVVEVTREWLERAYFQVSSRSKVEGTTIGMLRDTPDVVLIDIGLPGMSGDVLAQLVASQPLLSKTVVILYSGRSGDELAALVERCGAAGYIQKSRNEQQFLESLRRLISDPSAATKNSTTASV